MEIHYCIELIDFVVKIKRICGNLESSVCSSVISFTKSQHSHVVMLVVLSIICDRHGIDISGRFLFSDSLMHILIQPIKVITCNCFASWGGCAMFCRQLKGHRVTFTDLAEDSKGWKMNIEYCAKLAKADIHGKGIFKLQLGRSRMGIIDRHGKRWRWDWNPRPGQCRPLEFLWFLIKGMEKYSTALNAEPILNMRSCEDEYAERSHAISHSSHDLGIPL
ncbi:hypothetical protein VNO77_43813 [Canavalia gladiata]|uniref:Uncharacterized protein n=1 Tax=Canavalia gladiata TaxID=3824 RepID=A0AAN9PPS8_CANGL